MYRIEYADWTGETVATLARAKARLKQFYPRAGLGRFRLGEDRVPKALVWERLGKDRWRVVAEVYRLS